LDKCGELLKKVENYGIIKTLKYRAKAKDKFVEA